MASTLFSPIQVGSMTLPNRIAVSPMCQYSANDGSATDWHLQHWMMLAMCGAAMITMEATHVERRGRITHSCLGLYSDDNEASIERTLSSARRVAPQGTKFGIQIGHAGRKASSKRPWEGGGALAAHEDPWPTVAPSAISYGDGWHVPQALDDDGIAGVVKSFVTAARRAERAGFDFVELHAGHGYLLHQFLSPIANQRTDAWGGTLENRMRLVVAIAREVRASLPPSMEVGARLSATDWMDGGFNPDEAVVVTRALKAAGLTYLCVTTAGIHVNAEVPAGPAFQVPFAERIRRETGIVTRAVGFIDDPFVAEGIIAEGKADLVALARGILADPRWPWRAAIALGERPRIAPQYARAASFVKDWHTRREMTL